ncbi:hypothetical protein K525DRAFT_274179 [Schizophyllum commune Loenen D]|nr:hypothetical protein K525DRAFT_274179 [Schizophyllum commune Loenen D]
MSALIDASKHADLLAEILSGPLASIELLPGDIQDWSSAGLSQDQPFLLQEGNLGIPIKLLYILYVCAATQFSPVLKAYRADPSPASATSVASLSSIVILGNPAHQTAFSARKTLVLDSHLDPRAELELTTHFLTASKDGAKQSALWDHRRWLLQRMYPSPSVQRPARKRPRGWSTDVSRCPALPPSVIEHELSLALRACEMYPRNYHAWVYRHAIFESILHILEDADVPDSHRTEMFNLVEQETQTIMSWIDCHVSDYTAMQHSCSVVLAFSPHLRRSGSLPSSEVDGRHPSPLSDPFVLAEHAMDLLRTYPQHEALSRYLQLTLKMFELPSEMQKRAEELLEAICSVLS